MDFIPGDAGEDEEHSCHDPHRELEQGLDEASQSRDRERSCADEIYSCQLHFLFMVSDVTRSCVLSSV